jgi:hypothetical protein
MQDVLQLLDYAEQLGRVRTAGEVAMQRDEHAAAGEAGLVVAQTLGVSLERVACCAHGNLEGLRARWAAAGGAGAVPGAALAAAAAGALAATAAATLTAAASPTAAASAARAALAAATARATGTGAATAPAAALAAAASAA